MKNGFIKSENELSALHTATLEVPVTRKEGFVWRGPPLCASATRGSLSPLGVWELCGSAVAGEGAE